MQILELRAANEKEALKKGAEILQVDTESISIKVHKKGGGGFLGIGSKGPSVFYVETVDQSTPLEGVMRGVVLSLLNKMGLEAGIDRIEEQEEEKTCIHIASEKAGHIIGKRGKTLESLQFLTNLLVHQYSGEPPKILLDIENYRARRAKYLSDLAIKIASQVVKYGKSRLLEPLNPFERRLIHIALQEDDRVETESEGIGVYKRVRIKSKRNASKEPRKDRKERSETSHEIPDNDPHTEAVGGPLYTEEEEEKLSQSVLVDPSEEMEDDFHPHPGSNEAHDVTPEEAPLETQAETPEETQEETQAEGQDEVQEEAQAESPDETQDETQNEAHNENEDDAEDDAEDDNTKVEDVAKDAAASSKESTN